MMTNASNLGLLKGVGKMDTTKAYFIKRANQHGILLVRERNPKEDFTGWGAFEFILNNGEIFVISGYPFGQGEGEDGLWVDMNVLDEKTVNKFKAKTLLENRSKFIFKN